MAGSSIYFANSPDGARTFMWARSLVGPPGAMVDGWNGPLEQVDSFRFQIPRSYKPQMRTSGLIFVDEPMIPQLRQDRAPEQVANVATMPGIVGMAMAMPDIHWGYGFPIGGIAAFDYDTGVISPGGIGYDINCGVRLIRTDLTEADVRPHLRALTDACFKNVPSGVGEGGLVKVSRQDLAKLATDGVAWSVEKGYAWPEDVDHIEAEGHLPDADFSRVGDRAITRGKDQVGSLGAGNHFVEIQKVDRVYDARAAKAFGIDSVGTACARRSSCTARARPGRSPPDIRRRPPNTKTSASPSWSRGAWARAPSSSSASRPRWNAPSVRAATARAARCPARLPLERTMRTRASDRS